jgi:hypothetical protein
MRKTINAVAIMSLAGLMAISTEASAGVNTILKANNEVGASVTESLFNYQENIARLPADTESGWNPGFAVNGSYMGKLFGIHDVYAETHFGYTSGNVAYMGSLSNGSVYNGTDNSTTYRVMGRLGKGCVLSRSSMITPYITGGVQHWNRNLTGPYGYTENYSAGLIGAGAKYQYALTSRLVVGANANVLAVIDGQMTPSIYSGRLGSAQFATSGEENVGVTTDYRVSGPLHLFGGVHYTHFNYTGGPLKGGFVEPSSQTNQFNINAGVAYSFY